MEVKKDEQLQFAQKKIQSNFSLFTKFDIYEVYLLSYSFP